MRFCGDHEVAAPVHDVWTALHDCALLRSVIPGCAALVPGQGGVHAATLQARVGPVADTYRGTFTIIDRCPGTELEVRVAARGRCGRLEVVLRVAVADGVRPGTTLLRYDADAAVGGLAARLGSATLTVVGAHFTGGFFARLDRAVRRGAPVAAVAVARPA